MIGKAKVVGQLEEWKDALERKEAAQMNAMAREWLALERRLDGEFAALAESVARKQAEGTRVGVSQLVGMERYKSLVQQARAEINGKYVGYASELIGREQAAYGALGAEQAVEMMKGLGVTGSFDRLPVQAIEAMAGFGKDGSPLNVLLRAAWPDAVDGLTRSLVQAVALGKNPRETAKLMKDGFGAGLNRALVIARTEQLRAYRESSRMQYEASGLISGYRRIAAKQDRTCMACLLADGQFYEVNEPFEEHPNGRCTLIPVVKGMEPVQWETGKDWFLGLDAAQQEAMMGKGAFEGWQAGDFGLDDLVVRVEDETWGAYLKPAAVGDLV